MDLSRHVHNLFKNLSLIVNFNKKGLTTKDILKEATEFTPVAAIN